MRIHQGFSLIELMITVGIIGILVLVGQPMYGDYVKRVRLTIVVKEMFDFSNKMRDELTINDGDRFAIAASFKDLCIKGSIKERGDMKQVYSMQCDVHPMFSDVVPNRTRTNAFSKINVNATNDGYNNNLGIQYYYDPQINNGSYIDYDFIDITIFIEEGRQMNTLYLGSPDSVDYFSIDRQRPLIQLKAHKQDPEIDNKVFPPMEIVKKGETSPIPATKGIWYCGFNSYYPPQIIIMPSVCRHLQLGRDNSIYVEI